MPITSISAALPAIVKTEPQKAISEAATIARICQSKPNVVTSAIIDKFTPARFDLTVRSGKAKKLDRNA